MMLSYFLLLFFLLGFRGGLIDLFLLMFLLVYIFGFYIVLFKHINLLFFIHCFVSLKMLSFLLLQSAVFIDVSQWLQNLVQVLIVFFGFLKYFMKPLLIFPFFTR